MRFLATIATGRSAATLAISLLPGLAMAHPPAPHRHSHTAHHWHSWQPVLQAGVTFGGEKLVEVDVDSYYDHDEEDIRAGESLLLGGGLLYDDGAFQLQATVNYFTDGIFADNGEATFTRWPLELLAFHAAPHWRIGGGVTYHMDPEFELDIDGAPREEVNFENAFGAVVQIDYRATEQINIGLRFTSIEYEPDFDRSVKIDGDNIGLVFSAAL